MLEAVHPDPPLHAIVPSVPKQHMQLGLKYSILQAASHLAKFDKLQVPAGLLCPYTLMNHKCQSKTDVKIPDHCISSLHSSTCSEACSCCNPALACRTHGGKMRC